MLTITVVTPGSLSFSEPVCVGTLVCFFSLFMFHTAPSNIFVLLTFGQPTFKALFNLSKRCRGSEQHLNNIVSANILPSVQREALRQSTIYSLLHQKSCIYI